eukprot:6663628-Alexandrium_andersonii.AAC.1
MTRSISLVIPLKRVCKLAVAVSVHQIGQTTARPALSRISPSIDNGRSSGPTCAIITLLHFSRPDEPASQGW